MIDVSKFKLNIKIKVTKPKRAPRDVPTNKKLTKLVTGKVLYEDGKYRCRVKYTDYYDRLAKDVKIEEITDKAISLILKFTDESFITDECSIIFTRERCEDGNYLCIIRDKTHVLTFKPDNNRFLPFAPNWLVRGWIVLVNGEVRFKFKAVLTVDGYDYNIRKLIDDEEIQWHMKKK